MMTMMMMMMKTKRGRRGGKGGGRAAVQWVQEKILNQFMNCFSAKKISQ